VIYDEGAGTTDHVDFVVQVLPGGEIVVIRGKHGAADETDAVWKPDGDREGGKGGKERRPARVAEAKPRAGRTLGAQGQDDLLERLGRWGAGDGLQLCAKETLVEVTPDGLVLVFATVAGVSTLALVSIR
jgi:hypothetical protein